MLILSPSQNAHHCYMRTFTPFVIKGDGEGYFLLRGHEIKMNEFLDMFPLPDKVIVRNEGQYKGDGIGSAGI